MNYVIKKLINRLFRLGGTSIDRHHMSSISLEEDNIINDLNPNEELEDILNEIEKADNSVEHEYGNGLDSDSDESCEDESYTHETTSSETNDLIDSLEISNPFFTNKKIFIDNELQKCSDVKCRQFYNEFDRLLILCLKDNCTISDNFYSNPITIEIIKSYKHRLILVEGSINMLRNIYHRNNVVILDNRYINSFNHNDLELYDNELLLPLINISYSDVKLYIQQFKGTYDIGDYLKLKVMNGFYNQNRYITMLKILDSTTENSYWEDRYNCKLNFTNKFLDRKFSLNEIKNNKNNDVIKMLKKIPNEGDNYLSFLYRKQKYTDISSIISENGFRKYIINDDVKLDKNDINYVFDNISSQLELYKFVMNMIVSKQYSHLILNNEKILDCLWDASYLGKIVGNQNNQKSFMEKYILSIKYVIGYAWISLYMEESIKKSRIVDDDRFVFSINTASDTSKVTYGLS